MSFECVHCHKSFRKEETLITHLCEQRRRWEDRNTVVGQMALDAYIKFYQQCQPGKVKKDWQDFAASRYYSAFRKFAQYNVDIKCVNVNAYLAYLLKNHIALDRWCRDGVYEEFMLAWSRTEPAWDAIQRSLLTAADWADQSQSDPAHYFRYATDSRVISDIVRGRISAWLIYASSDGINWLQSLLPEQQRLIYDWIDPEYWQGKIQSETDWKDIQEMLTKLGMNL